MYNTYPYNTNLYNSLFSNEFPSSENPFTAQDGEIIFNGFKLQDAEIVTSAFGQLSGHRRDIPAVDVLNENGQVYLRDQARERIIIVRGNLYAASASSLLDSVDEFKREVQEFEGFLDWNIDGQRRRVAATLQNTDSMFTIRDHFHIDFIPYSLEFRIVDFSFSPDSEVSSFTAQTSQLLTPIFSIGTAPNYPRFLFVFNTTTATKVVVKINNEEIEINESIGNNNVLEIDGENRIVKLDTVEIDYNGFFPRIFPGQNQLDIDVTGTYDYNLDITYFPNYR